MSGSWLASGGIITQSLGGAIIKIAAVPEKFMGTFSGPARVFDSLDDGLAALRAGKIKPGDACVLRFLGLKGRLRDGIPLP